MNIKKKYLTILASPILLLPTFLISCSSSSDINFDNPNIEEIIPPENSDNVIIQPPIINDNDFKVNISWKKGFQNENTFFFNGNNNYIFNLGDIIINQDGYIIQYVGSENDVYYYSLFDETIKKYYLLSLNFEYEKLSQIWSMSKIKQFLFQEITSDYSANMIINHNVSDENFFVPIDTSDSSISFEKNDIITFESSWGVWNNQQGNAILNINIDHAKIRKMLFGSQEQNYDNYIIQNIQATDLYLLPKVILIDSPINYFNFNIDDIQNNNTKDFYTLSDNEKSKIEIDLPNNGNKYVNWSCSICNNTMNGIVINEEFIGGISSQIANLIKFDANNYDNVLEKIQEPEKNQAKNYFAKIIDKGKRISLNIKQNYIESSSLVNLKVFASIFSGANSMNLIADGSSIAIYDISGIQKMNINFKEYKKF